MDMERLFSPAHLEGEAEAAYDVIVYDRDEVFYSTVKEAGEFLSYYKTLPGDGAGSFQDVGTFVVGQRDLEGYGLALLLLFDNKEVLKRQQESWVIVLPIALALTAIVLAFSYLYSKSFSSRIERLVWKFKQAETGDLGIREPIQGNDEIAVLDRQFGHMLVQLDRKSVV